MEMEMEGGGRAHLLNFFVMCVSVTLVLSFFLLTGVFVFSSSR